MRRPVLLLVLVSFVLAACTWGSDDSDRGDAPEPQPTPTTSISFDDLGVANWPSPDEARFPDPPARPEWLPAEEYARMVAAVRTWAVQAVASPDEVGAGLPDELAAMIDDAGEDDEVASALAKGNVLDPGLEVLATGLTGAWTLSDDGESMNLALQTRAAYEVRIPDGPVRVIGVLRTQGIIAGADSPEWGTIMGWQEFGAADCAIALDGFLTAGGDADDQQSDLATFTKIGNGDEAITPELPDDQLVDEDFKRRCEAGRV
ncbi:hypothetical protein [Aeromicrobium duanguangcaii]|uniref:Lipoprotein n=1 Tax=Aeromicrobium duanguangcaii TaxID=2968086 RepID=A0ABY5KGH6_9ACTN|nr:hypothetical protein [Aeromicrobium duanguangcaii]MCD9155194.1 hypothetical protein [Aeromicrobium duanguangcaii]UUI68155.1 hypothetical protein NP095_13220 [Aeromicrobium duanguangcaii]